MNTMQNTIHELPQADLLSVSGGVSFEEYFSRDEVFGGAVRALVNDDFSTPRRSSGFSSGGSFDVRRSNEGCRQEIVSPEDFGIFQHG